MRTVVISQPMFFPWVGMLEQMSLADAFVFYDDVQFSKGSFTNRVQIKTAAGPAWLTVPLRDQHLGQRIDDVRTDEDRGYRRAHLEKLRQAYRGAPHARDMLELVAQVYAEASDRLTDLAERSSLALAEYYGVLEGKLVRHSSAMGVPGRGSARVLDLVTRLRGDVYVTGHGGRDYLDHAAFAARRVRVEYMDYAKRPYPQLHGGFTPFVSALDLVANMGRGGRPFIAPATVTWEEFAA
jgi:hypothetical protein